MALVAYATSDDGSDVNSDDEKISTSNLQPVSLASVSDQAAVSQSLLAQGDDIVEEEYRMRIPASAKTGGPLTCHSMLPAKKKSNGKMMFAIPSLDEFDSSDDDDNDTATKSKSAVKKKSSSNNPNTTGLLGLLPQPKAMIVNEGNRPLLMVPQSVSRPSASSKAKKPIPSAKESSHSLPSIVPEAKEDDEEDNETGEGGFFSFYDASTEAAEMAANVKKPEAVSAMSRDSTYQIPGASHLSRVDYGPVTGPLLQPSSSEDFTSASVSDIPPRKKLRTGGIPDNAINDIIDVNQADLVAGAQLELTKALSMGGVGPDDSSWAHRPDPHDMPGKTASRKHQITWLAFKAKEREFELQNMWAENKFNKKQTQSKYGF